MKQAVAESEREGGLYEPYVTQQGLQWTSPLPPSGCSSLHSAVSFSHRQQNPGLGGSLRTAGDPTHTNMSLVQHARSTLTTSLHVSSG